MAIRRIVTAGCIALGLLAATSAQAGGLDVDINLGGPAYYPAPVYVAPAPVYTTPYYPHYYDPRHRNHDYWYWQERHRGNERHDERHDYRR